MLTQIICPIAQQADENHQPAIITPNAVVTYSELNAMITSFANILPETNNPLAIIATNTVNTIAFVFACFRRNITVCLLSTRLTDKQVQEQCQLTNSEIINPDSIRFQKNNNDSIRLNLDQNATIMFSSGSSGHPKAVLHTIANHYYSADQSNTHIPLEIEDRWLLTLPIYHVGGLSILWRCFTAKATVVILKDNTAITDKVFEHSITHISMVPTQLYRLLKQNIQLPTLKCVLLGGGAIPRDLIEKSIYHQLPLYTTYGLTEMSSQVATSDLIQSVEDSYTAQPLKYTEIKINDGCVYTKGLTRFKGYVDHGKLIKPFDEEWFNTQDLGKIDQKGALQILGRQDNMFISGGENIQPEEIERTLLADRRIEEALIIPKDDAEFGQRPIAFIKGAVTRNELVDICKNKLEGFKLPEAFYKLPEYASMKPNRKLLQSAFVKDPQQFEPIS